MEIKFFILTIGIFKTNVLIRTFRFSRVEHDSIHRYESCSALRPFTSESKVYCLLFVRQSGFQLRVGSKFSFAPLRSVIG